MQIVIKRIFSPPEKMDGRRILVDRLWPRGVSKKNARLDFWAKSVAPSHELRQWYGHDPSKWDKFLKKYFSELDSNPEGVAELKSKFGKGPVTFLFGSKEERLNNATALKEYIKTKYKG